MVETQEPARHAERGLEEGTRGALIEFVLSAKNNEGVVLGGGGEIDS